ncbi:MAG: GNAT family N-acetyltransferase [Nitrospirota bacterium]
MNILIEAYRSIANPTPGRPSYAARLAQDANEVRRAQQLRFEVFNLELGEGLADSYATGLDVDPFDEFCDHLIVEECATGEIVGTYRLQTGQLAAANLGYYSEREFDFAPYEPFRCEMIELGRACVHAAHRNFNLLHLLWRGIARYAVERNARFLIGCSSLTSQDPYEGATAYQQLKDHLVEPALRTEPREPFVVAGGDDAGYVYALLHQRKPGATPPATAGASSKLLRAYLAIGAKICGPPAIDREFGTIDFLTLLDLHRLPAVVRAHFLR